MLPLNSSMDFSILLSYFSIQRIMNFCFVFSFHGCDIFVYLSENIHYISFKISSILCIVSIFLLFPFSLKIVFHYVFHIRGSPQISSYLIILGFLLFLFYFIFLLLFLLAFICCWIYSQATSFCFFSYFWDICFFCANSPGLGTICSFTGRITSM